MINVLGSKSCPQTYIEGTHLAEWEADKHCPVGCMSDLEYGPQDPDISWDEEFSIWVPVEDADHDITCPGCGTGMEHVPGVHLTFAGVIPKLSGLEYLDKVYEDHTDSHVEKDGFLYLWQHPCHVTPESILLHAKTVHASVADMDECIATVKEAVQECLDAFREDDPELWQEHMDDPEHRAIYPSN